MIRRYLLLGGAHLLASAFGFAGTWLVVDRFGAAGLGDIALALSLAEYTALIAALGTPIYAVTRIAAAPTRVARVTANVLAVRVLAGAVAYCGLILALSLVPRFASLRSLGLVFGLIAFVAAVNVTFVAQALDRTVVLAAANVATQAAYLVGLATVLFIFAEPVAVAWSKLAAEALIAAGLLIWMVRRIARIDRPSPPAELGRFAVAAAPIGGSNLLRHVTHTSDLLVVGLLVAPTALGHYAAAARLAAFVGALGAPYFVLLLPRLAASAQRPNGALARQLERSQRLAVPLAAVAAALLALGARPLLALLFGSPFADAGTNALRLLALAFVISFAGRHQRQVLLVRGGQRTDLLCTLAAAGVHLTAKLLLIPFLGVAGAALGAVVGNLVLLILLTRAARAVLAETTRSSNPASDSPL